MAWPALDPGRLLERCGDVAPRRMTVHDRTRLTGRLRHLLSGVRPSRRCPRFVPPLAVQNAGPAPGIPNPCGCRRAPLTQGGLHSGALLERRVVCHRWNCCRWNCLVMTAAFCSGLRRGMSGPDLFAFHRLRWRVPEGRMGAARECVADPTLIRRCAPPSPAGGRRRARRSSRLAERGRAVPESSAFHRLRGKVPEGRMGAPWGRGAHSLIRRWAPPSPAGGRRGAGRSAFVRPTGSDAWARPGVSCLIVPPRSTGVSKSPAASRPGRCRSGRSGVRG
ncbi:hypothetical protein CFBP6773_03410 [Xanthomonas arboricola pv. fragariae]|nr:hypothetical protein CFBP6773_03410 [Xanthomonas arboricola pv. fragariae]